MTINNKTLVVIVAAAALAVVAVLGLTLGPEKWRQRKQKMLAAQAKMALARGDYEQVEKLYTELLEYLPGNLSLMVRLSQVCAAMKKFDRAYEWIDKAAGLATDEAGIKAQRASVCQQEAAYTLEQLPEPAEAAAFEKIVKLCDEATQLLQEAGKKAGASPQLQAEAGQVFMVRADIARRRASDAQDRADAARLAGQSDQANTYQTQADKWRAQSDEHLMAAMKETGTAAKLSPKDIRIGDLFVEACYRARRWSDVVVAYRTATTVTRPTPRTVIRAVRAQMTQGAGTSAAAQAQAVGLAREMLTQAEKNYPYSPELKLEMARVELEAGSVEAAEKSLEKAASLSKPSTDAKLLRARVLLKRDDPQEARELLRALLAEKPCPTDVKVALATVEGRCGDPDRSLELLRQAVAGDPDHVEARVALARALVGRGLWAQAMTIMRNGVYRAPTDVSLVRQAVSLAVQLDRADEVNALITRSQRVAAGNPVVLKDLAVLCLRLGRADWMKRIVTESMKVDSGGRLAQMASAAGALDQGKTDEAIKLMGPLGSRDDQPAEIHLTLAQAYNVLGQYQNAHEQLERAFVAGQDDYLVALRAVDLYADAGMLTQATSRGARLLNDAPEAPASLWQAAKLALWKGDLAEATQRVTMLGAVGWQATTPLQRATVDLVGGRYEQAIKVVKDQRDPLSRLVAHYGLAGLGRFDQAANELEDAIKAHPRRVQLYLRLADHLAAGGKAAAGIARLRALTRLDMAHAALAVGRMQSLAGQHDEAIATYQRLLTGKTTNLDKQTEARMRLAMAACYRAQRKTNEEMAVYWEMQKDSAMGIRGLEENIKLRTLLRQTKEVEGLLNDFVKSPNSDKFSPDILARIASAYDRIGKLAEAGKQYDRIAVKLPGAIWPYRSKAKACARAGQAGQAMEVYRQALLRWPGDRSLMRDLAGMLVRINQFPQALDTLDGIATSKQTGAVVVERDRALLLTSLGLYEHARGPLDAILARPGMVDFEATLAVARCLSGLGQTDDATKKLAGIPTTSGHYSAARAAIAQVQLDKGQTDQALQILTEALDKATDADGLARSLYSLRLRNGQVDEAIRLARDHAGRSSRDALQWAVAGGVDEVLESLHEDQPTNTGLAVRLGAWLLAKGNWKGVARVLADHAPATRSSTTQPTRKPGPGAETILALSELAGGKDELAAKRLDALLAQDDGTGQWRAIAAIARLATKMPAPLAQLAGKVGTSPDRALFDELAKQSTTEAGRRVAQWVAASLAARRLGIPTLSYRFAEAAVQADPKSMAALYNQLATLWAMGAGKTDKAKALTTALTKTSGDSPLAQDVRVRELANGGKLDQAIESLNAWAKKGKLPADLANYVGTLALEQGKLTEALRWFEACLEQNPDNASAANNAAYLLAELKDQDTKAMDRALELAEKAFRLSGQVPSAGETLGWVLVKRKQAEKGLALLQRAIVPLSNDIRAHYHIGVAYEASRRPAMARLHLEHVAQRAKDKALAETARKALERLPKSDAPTTSKAI